MLDDNCDVNKDNIKNNTDKFYDITENNKVDDNTINDNKVDDNKVDDNTINDNKVDDNKVDDNKVDDNKVDDNTINDNTIINYLISKDEAFYIIDKTINSNIPQNNISMIKTTNKLMSNALQIKKTLELHLKKIELVYSKYYHIKCILSCLLNRHLCVHCTNLYYHKLIQFNEVVDNKLKDYLSMINEYKKNEDICMCVIMYFCNISKNPKNTISSPRSESYKRVICLLKYEIQIMYKMIYKFNEYSMNKTIADISNLIEYFVNTYKILDYEKINNLLLQLNIDKELNDMISEKAGCNIDKYIKIS